MPECKKFMNVGKIIILVIFLAVAVLDGCYKPTDTVKSDPGINIPSPPERDPNNQLGSDKKDNNIDSIFNEFTDENISDKRRDQLVEELKNKEFKKIVEKLLEIMIYHYAPACVGCIADSNKPWMSDSYSVKDKIWFAAGAVWYKQIDGKKDPEKAEHIISLLKSRKDDGARVKLLNALNNYQWVDNAEGVVSDIIKNKKESLHLRSRAISILLSHLEISKYLPAAIEIINEHEGKERIQAYANITNLGNRLFLLSGDNRNALIKLGFQILQEECKDGSSGYFLARRLGFILHIPREFAPDQNLKKYQGEYSLTDEFFKDTVKNALEWYKNNQK